MERRKWVWVTAGSLGNCWKWETAAQPSPADRLMHRVTWGKLTCLSELLKMNTVFPIHPRLKQNINRNVADDDHPSKFFTGLS